MSIMYNPKALKALVVSAQGTRRITSAMKMVALTKLKKAQDAAEQARPYATRMAAMLTELSKGKTAASGGHELLVGNGKDKTHLIILVSSDRGLCAGFNAQLARAIRADIAILKNQNKIVKLLIVGRKGNLLLKKDYQDIIIATYEDLNKPMPLYAHANTVMTDVLERFAAGEFDTCSLYFNEFISTISQKVAKIQMIPFSSASKTSNKEAEKVNDAALNSAYAFEPEEDVILAALLPQNLRVQLFSVMQESFAAEQAARMVAMDNATRNSTELITVLSTRYNRVRQAFITKELIEIISGAEAL